ncbi:MAG: 5-oxoprolinase subunit PxpA [Marinoscillum sp.]
MKKWLLNCDMGESMGNDHLIMPHINACSVACGGHSGDEATMTETVRLALKHEVEIGAHPSFPDKENFGRKSLSMPSDTLINSLTSQIKLLQEICNNEQAVISHIKPHGALYNEAITDLKTAVVIIQVMKKFPGLTLFAPWKSVVAELAQEDDIPVTFEGFADRRYEHDGSLAPRTSDDSVIKDPAEAYNQVKQIVNYQKLTSIDGITFDFEAETFCIHGDNPNAVSIVRRLSESAQ